MNLQKLSEALVGVGVPVYHFRAPSGTKAPYLIWGEDGSGQNLHADGALEGQVIQGTVDLFTRTACDPLAEGVQGALTGAELPWRLNSIQYEEDTGLIHYEWVWEVC